MNIQNSRMEITTTMGCKVDCKYCPQKVLLKQYFSVSRESNQKKVMSFEDFKFFIDKLSKDVLICFAGMAEPWLNKECTKMVLYASKKGHSLAVYTTLVGFTLNDFEQIKDLEFEEFVVHLPDVENNSKIDVTEEYLHILREVSNYKSINGPLVTDYSCHGEIQSSVRSMLSDHVKNETEFNDRAGNLDEPSIRKIDEKQGEILCLRCKDRLNHNVLLPDGSILLCCMDYGMKHVLGNLFDSSYEEILSSDVANYVREGMCYEKQSILCRRCVNAVGIREIYDSYYEYYNWSQSLFKENKRLQSYIGDKKL